MPLQMAPAIRAINEYREASGIYQTQNSVAVTKALADEAAGRAVKVVPVADVNIYLGVKYTAH